MLSGFTDVFVTPHLKVYPQRDRNLKSGAKSNEKMQFQRYIPYILVSTILPVKMLNSRRKKYVVSQ